MSSFVGNRDIGVLLSHVLAAIARLESSLALPGGVSLGRKPSHFQLEILSIIRNADSMSNIS